MTPLNAAEHKSLIEQMFRLRARQFANRRNWRVSVEDGREIDYFDTLDPTYVLVSNDAGILVASLRVLPTTGPHMLADVFRDIMAESSVIRHPLIWESSRFCIDPAVARNYGPDGINMVTREVLHGLFSLARDCGVQNVVSVYDLMVERILRRAGCLFDRIGSVVEYDDGLLTTAGLFEVSDEVIDRLTSMRKPERLLEGV
ncbi:acyl-homoserine-lactone synthase [Ensifer adhaerens]|uniref:acyl-homoserine-lactone synthase n=1 Tax=Ensifer adhaerens TaxID=106592 RepID=UPI0018F828CE|nr:acyl-homoserine-lactone synthase [Ensifer adhaerens]